MNKSGGNFCKGFLASLMLFAGAGGAKGELPRATSVQVAFDMEMAEAICDELPLEKVEGIWLYPEDGVSVLILNDDRENGHSLGSYTISVVETTDSQLHPGEIIGKIEATAQENVYAIELASERKNEFLLKPKTCTGTLSKEGDSFLFKREKSPLKARLNLNFNRLLPGFWKIISTGISATGVANSTQPPVGMVKIYPSYDGNGSSRRKVRYL